MPQQYDKTMIRHARNLRKNMTPWERKLWYTFLRHYPRHIYKQRVIGPFIVDFYCDVAKLAIELDGSQHFMEEQSAYDESRSAYLNELEIEVLRIPNIEVDRHFNEVCELIDRTIQRRVVEGERPLRPCGPAPLEGEPRLPRT